MFMNDPARLRFELTTLGGAETAAQYSSRDSATYRTLFETGVPRTFLEWVITADPEVSVYQAGDIGPLLRFARLAAIMSRLPLLMGGSCSSCTPTGRSRGY